MLPMNNAQWMDVNYARKLHYAIGNSNHPNEQLGRSFYQRLRLPEVRSEYWNIFRRISPLRQRQLHQYHFARIPKDHPKVRKITVDISDCSISMEAFSTWWKTGNPIRLHPIQGGGTVIYTLFIWTESWLIIKKIILMRLSIPNVLCNAFKIISKHTDVRSFICHSRVS